MDIALLYRTNRAVKTDIELDGSDLLVDHDLETAIIISLFTDRRANPDDVVESEDRRGWWADTFTAAQNYKIGSRLWLLSREKQTDEVLTRARAYVTESLQWLIDDNVVDRIELEVEFVERGMLGIKIDVFRPQGLATFKYQYVWDRL